MIDLFTYMGGVMKKIFSATLITCVILCFDIITNENNWVFATPINSDFDTAQNKGVNVMISQKQLEKYKNYLAGPIVLESPALTQMYAAHNDGISGSSDIVISDLGRVELPWYNGNYLVWNTSTGEDGVYAAGEFDKDKSLVGLVIIIQEGNIIHTCEYIDNGAWNVPLKTYFLYDETEKIALLYDNNKNILISAVNGQKKVENSSLVTNPDFITEIIFKLEKPKKYVVPYKD